MLTSETVYRKVGRRYVPCGINAAYNSLHMENGDWLVVVNNGCRSYRLLQSGDRPAVLAVIRRLQDELCAAISEANRGTPDRAPVTPEERQAWDALIEILGRTSPMVIRPSLYEVVTSALDKVVGVYGGEPETCG